MHIVSMEASQIRSKMVKKGNEDKIAFCYSFALSCTTPFVFMLAHTLSLPISVSLFISHFRFSCLLFFSSFPFTLFYHIQPHGTYLTNITSLYCVYRFSFAIYYFWHCSDGEEMIFGCWESVSLQYFSSGIQKIKN